MTKETVGHIMERNAYRCLDTATLEEVTAQLIELGVSSLPLSSMGASASSGSSATATSCAPSPSIKRAPYSRAAHPPCSITMTNPSRTRCAPLKRATSWRLATRKVLCVTETQSIGRVADILSKKKFKKLPVIDDDGRLVGIIRRSSIMKYVFDLLFSDQEA